MIPQDIDDPLVVSAWMLEKACVQQADAYLREIGKDLDESAPMAALSASPTGLIQR
jgi:hypothetical protein